MKALEIKHDEINGYSIFDLFNSDGIYVGKTMGGISDYVFKR